MPGRSVQPPLARMDAGFPDAGRAQHQLLRRGCGELQTPQPREEAASSAAWETLSPAQVAGSLRRWRPVTAGLLPVGLPCALAEGAG